MSSTEPHNSIENDRNKESKKEKTPAIETFPTDETPTPTKILRMADMDLFQDLKENPFDVHFRKAAEAVKQGKDSLSASLSATEIPADDTLNTPQIYCPDGSTPHMSNCTPSAPRPVILRANPHNKIIGSGVPVASVQPVKTYKPIAPNLASLPTVPSPENAMLLLKFPGGETVKLSNLPFVKADPPPSPPVNQETRLKLKRVLSNPRGHPVEIKSPTHTLPTLPAGPKNSEQNPEESEKNELKERNRMSAQRSRQKKRQHFESLVDTCSNMQKENSALNTENKILREEIVSLKRLLGQHLECSVTQQTGQREVVQNAIEPRMISLVENQTKTKKIAHPATKKTIPNPPIISRQTEENFMKIPVILSNECEKSCQSNNHENPPINHYETPSNQACNSPDKYEMPNRSVVYMNKSAPITPSPPQTFPEDLRVDTRLKDTEHSCVSVSRPSVVTQDTNKETPVQSNILTNIGQSKPLLTSTRLKPSKPILTNIKVTQSKPLLTNIAVTSSKPLTPTKPQLSNFVVTPSPSLPSPVFVRLTPNQDNVKQTLALHCHRVGSEREEKSTTKGVVAKRLKDKLQILKQKMAEEASIIPLPSVDTDQGN